MAVGLYIGGSPWRIKIGPGASYDLGQAVARYHPKSCRVCGVQASAEEPISAQGYCLEHGLQRMQQNNREISPQVPDTGPFSDHWRERCVAAFGGILPERETA